MYLSPTQSYSSKVIFDVGCPPHGKLSVAVENNFLRACTPSCGAYEHKCVFSMLGAYFSSKVSQRKHSHSKLPLEFQLMRQFLHTHFPRHQWKRKFFPRSKVVTRANLYHDEKIHIKVILLVYSFAIFALHFRFQIFHQKFVLQIFLKNRRAYLISDNRYI